MYREYDEKINFPLDIDDPFKGYVYSRISDPKVDELEKKLAKMENVKYCLAFSSGMSAISTLFWTILRPGKHMIISNDCYTSTYKLSFDLLKKWGVKTTLVDHRNPENIIKAIQRNTRLVFIETPSNPMLQICDLEKTADIIKYHNQNILETYQQPVLFAVDNTFATPLLQSPLKLGADLVIHSTTKAINGHSNAVGGAIMTDNQAMYEQLFEYRTTLGPIQQPTNAWLTLNGARTIKERLAKQCETAHRLAEWLEKQTEIDYVLYPALKSFPQKELAEKQMKNAGTMISFAVRGNLETAKNFLRALKKIAVKVSLGSVESYIEIPYTMSHHDIAPGRIPYNLIRLSVGYEDFEELKEDLERGLNAIK